MSSAAPETAAAAETKKVDFPSVLDKPLPKGTSTVPLSTFTYIFIEMFQYYQNKSDSAHELENG